MEGYLMKKGRENNQFLPRKFVLRYFLYVELSDLKEIIIGFRRIYGESFLKLGYNIPTLFTFSSLPYLSTL